MSVSRRAAEIQPFYVMEAVRAAAQREAAGHEVLHLEVGQPATQAPAAVKAAAHDAIDNDTLGYTMAKGIVELRERIVAWYLDRYGVTVDPERILITPGASGSCALAFLSLFGAGDRVGVLEPGYPCYRNDLSVVDIDVVDIPVGPQTSYRPTPELLDEHLPLDGLVIASPSNPTGTVLDRDRLGEIVTWAAANDVSLIVDEIYHGITYGNEEGSGGDGSAAGALATPSALEFDDGRAEITVFNSFSKYWSMTGWRLGWVVAPVGTEQAFERVMANLLISAPTMSQIAGVAAFDSIEECEANVAQYARNRQIVLDGLVRAGITDIAPPDGAFYVWADVGHLLSPASDITDSMELCARWLDDIGVAVTPGVDFDPARGDRFIRLSYAGDEAAITEAMQRIAAWTP